MFDFFCMIGTSYKIFSRFCLYKARIQVDGDEDKNDADNNNDTNDHGNTNAVDVDDDNADNEDDDRLLTLHDAPARSDSRVFQSQVKTVLITNRRPDHLI